MIVRSPGRAGVYCDRDVRAAERALGQVEVDACVDDLRARDQDVKNRENTGAILGISYVGRVQMIATNELRLYRPCYLQEGLRVSERERKESSSQRPTTRC